MENKLFIGSICLSELNARAKEGHPAFSRAANGKIYVNVNLWFNDEADQYGKIAQLQVQKPKDSDEKTIYIGNFGVPKKKEIEPIKANEIEDDDDFPF